MREPLFVKGVLSRQRITPRGHLRLVEPAPPDKRRFLDTRTGAALIVVAWFVGTIALAALLSWGIRTIPFGADP